MSYDMPFNYIIIGDTGSFLLGTRESSPESVLSEDTISLDEPVSKMNDMHLTQSFIDWTRIFHINYHILYKGDSGALLVHDITRYLIVVGRHWNNLSSTCLAHPLHLLFSIGMALRFLHH